MKKDFSVLPPGLPVPKGDGGADHLLGLSFPSLVLDSSQGRSDLGLLCARRAVIYLYPRTSAHLGEEIVRALQTYAAEVRGGIFPADEHGYRIPAEELALFEAELSRAVSV